MMSLYYLISQLPSLDGVVDSVQLPITEERFLELCSRFLGKKAFRELTQLTLMPKKCHEKSSSALVEAWNTEERELRLALGKVRAEKLKKTFFAEDTVVSAELMQLARTAVQLQDPMEAEKFLNRYRLDFLETLRPMDTFAEDAVFYYGLKLKLLLRIRQFDQSSGEAAYRNIYHSIMHGERPEVVQ